MAGRGKKGRKKQPQRQPPRQPPRRPRRSLFQRMGAWLPVGIVGVAAIAVVVVVVLVSNVARSSDSGGSIPERLVAEQGRTLGPENARVTINEYSDFQCPYCARAARTIDPQIEQTYVADGRVKLVFQTVAFIGDESVAAGAAAECANDQGKFWEYHDKLFENQHGENKGGFSTDNLKQFAVELGLDTQAFNQCVDSHQHDDLIKTETQDAKKKNIQSTPTFVMGDQTVAGPSSFADVQKAIEGELRKNP